MKCAELADALDHFEQIFYFTGNVAPQPLLELKKMLRSTSELSISQLCKKLDKLRISEPNSNAIAIDQVPELCRYIASFLKLTGKPAVLKEIEMLAASLGRFTSINAEDLFIKTGKGKASSETREVTTPKLELVQAHLRLLEQSLGDDVGFSSAFRSLEGDSNLGTAEYVALAKQFSFASTKSKTAALKKIWARHQALMTSRAKAAATAGRIAG